MTWYGGAAVKRHRYEIVVEAHLGDSWTDWFEGLAIRDEVDERGRPTRTILSGTMDQPMLHGALMRIRDLGLTLISVSRRSTSDGLGSCYGTPNSEGDQP
jgi:hypothetical protein